jgi:ABC-type dipeptide/oligopeptide/nickel transport system permease subunit
MFIKYPDGKYTIFGTDENGNDYFEILDIDED